MRDLASGMAQIGLQYAPWRSGPTALSPLGIFMTSDPRFETADVECHVQPLSLDRFSEPLHAFPALAVSVCNLCPELRGSVRIAFLDPLAHWEIAPNDRPIKTFATPGSVRDRD